MDLSSVKILWHYYKTYMLDQRECFNGYTLLDRVYYLSRMILQAIDLYCYRRNQLMLQEIKIPIRRDAFKSLYIFDSIGSDTISDELSSIAINYSEVMDNNDPYSQDSFVKFPMFVDCPDIIFILFNQELVAEENSNTVTINMIVSDEDHINDDGMTEYYYSSDEIDPDYDADNNYGDDYINLARFLLEAASGVLAICKIIEAAMLDVERDIHKNDLDYDYYGKDGLDNLLFKKVEKYFIRERYVTLLSDKKDIKNSKHLDWLDEARKKMTIHILTRDEILDKSTQMFIERLECVSIMGNGKIQNGLIVPDEIKNDIKTLLATKDNYGNPYDLVISCVTEPDTEVGGFKSSFPTVLVFHDNKIDTLEKLEDNMLKPSADKIRSWLSEELLARSIDEDMVTYGDDLMGSLKFDDNGTIVSSNDSQEVVETDVTKSLDEIHDALSIGKVKVGNIEEDIDESSEKEKLTPFTLSCKIAESMEKKFFDLLIAQMGLQDIDLKSLSDLLGKITSLSYNEYYSDKYMDNSVTFQDIFNQDNMVLNIVAKGEVIESLLFYVDSNANQWDCTRIYDKIHTAVGGFKSAFARACKFSKNAILSFNFCTYAGYYDADLAPVLKILDMPIDSNLSDTDLHFIRYDITMFVLSTIRQAILNRYVRNKISRGKHFIKDTFFYEKVIPEYNFHSVLSSIEDLLDNNKLCLEDISNIKRITELAMNDPDTYKEIESLIEGEKGLSLIYENGLVAHYVKDIEDVIGWFGRISKPQLYKKGIPFSIVKDDVPLLIIEDLGELTHYEFCKMLIKICKYFESCYNIESITTEEDDEEEVE